MDTVMLQFKHQGAAPSVGEIRRLFDLRSNEIDADFGVIATDPAAQLYTVLVAADVADRVAAALADRPEDPAEGVFSNPRVETCGPPRS